MYDFARNSKGSCNGMTLLTFGLSIFLVDLIVPLGDKKLYQCSSKQERITKKIWSVPLVFLDLCRYPFHGLYLDHGVVCFHGHDHDHACLGHVHGAVIGHDPNDAHAF